MKLYRMSLIVGLLAGVAASGSADSPVLTRIGVAAAVHGKIQVFTPQRPEAGHVVETGSLLYTNDVVLTGSEGRLQILLNDETVFTLGPNSSLVLDQFVYDADAGSGQLTVRIIKGVFRFVTGRIGHHKPSDMNVKFPTGTLGIRGTIVAGRVNEGRTLAVLLGPGPSSRTGERPGAFTLKNGGVSVLATRPGFGSHIDGPGIPPSRPAPVAPRELDALLGTLAFLPSEGTQGQVMAQTTDVDFLMNAGKSGKSGHAWSRDGFGDNEKVHGQHEEHGKHEAHGRHEERG